MSTPATDVPLKRTPLYDEHVRLGAKMVPFTGYEMPVQYPLGVLKEHLWTRDKTGLFDVSHMGQAVVVAEDGRHETVARALEALMPADIVNLKPGQQRYSQLLGDDGGILDDLMVSRSADLGHDGTLYLVVNAGCKDADYAHLRARLPKGVVLSVFGDRALLALQGPNAVVAFAQLAPDVAAMSFMTVREVRLEKLGIDAVVSRSGYTGEDGFEISVRNEDAAPLMQALLALDDVQPIGLGARDSLRLEAGLCLYGHDIDTTTSPIEAGLQWSIQKRRRLEGGFPGAARIQRELQDGSSRMRVGIKPEGRAPAREGTEIVSECGAKIGVVTSGGFGPSVNGPVAMGYVARGHGGVGTKVNLMVRGKPLPATVVAMPFHPHQYKRG
ncbi:MAG: glycine cleavage system aminomethyltransferase GcvT [Hyphomicrobiaceae bacterium]